MWYWKILCSSLKEVNIQYDNIKICLYVDLLVTNKKDIHKTVHDISELKALKNVPKSKL